MSVCRPPAVLVIALFALAASAGSAQRDVDTALLADITAIKAIDNHAHVMRPVADDRGFDALPLDALDPSPLPVYLRDDNPMFVRAWKALFAYPYDDASDAHAREAAALKQKAMAEHGAAYPAWVLDKLGFETMLANRIAMGPELTPPRFRWVPYADALIFPLDNSAAKAFNRDYAAFYPAEEKLLQQYVKESGQSGLPATLDDYCARVLTATFERHKGGGAVAEKFEIAYLRWLNFGPAPHDAAAGVYAKFVHAGRPSAADYKIVQDYLFAYAAREAGRLGLAIHIHVADGGGGNYDQRGSNPLLLTWLFNEASLRKTTFVVVHGGAASSTRQTAALLSKPNVYADFSSWSFTMSPRLQAAALRDWLSTYPEHVLFGTDATPVSDRINWEETGWVAATSARKALAIALSGMIEDGEIDGARARALARLVLHDNAWNLYGLGSDPRSPPRAAPREDSRRQGGRANVGSDPGETR
jgi:uncharacterized protein